MRVSADCGCEFCVREMLIKMHRHARALFCADKAALQVQSIWEEKFHV